MKIVFASNNSGKIQELQSLLQAWQIQLIPQAELNVPDIAETGLTFIENALLKARHASQQTGLPAIADDSGLEVFALKGAPGIYSARYAGEPSNAQNNIKKLLKTLENYPPEKRTAHFYCALVFLRYPDDPIPLIGEGFWKGIITQAPLGEKGFGYDPIFFDPQENQSAAQLSLTRKNQISHRAKALTCLIDRLKKLIHSYIKAAGMYALTVNHLKKVYPNGLIALKGIQLNVAEGDFFALLGPNGAGKSTTIGILCSLVNKTEGTVSVFGHDIDTQLEAAKSCIGVVPQELNFNPFEKVSQVLINQAGYYGIPRHIAAPRAEYYLKKMGLWEKQNHAILRLSGGMKRRLMIARSLMNEPKLLILDEPTAGVDIELRHILWAFLTELNQKGTTIILTTHYLEEAEYLCKNLAIIDHGEIIEHAAMKSLINRLHIQTLILDLMHPIDTLPVLNHFTMRLIDNTTLEVELRQDQSLNHLFNTLNEHHLQIKSMRNKTNRLEELFIRLINNNTGAHT